MEKDGCLGPSDTAIQELKKIIGHEYADGKVLVSGDVLLASRPVGGSCTVGGHNDDLRVLTCGRGDGGGHLEVRRACVMTALWALPFALT